MPQLTQPSTVNTPRIHKQSVRRSVQEGEKNITTKRFRNPAKNNIICKRIVEKKAYPWLSVSPAATPTLPETLTRNVTSLSLSRSKGSSTHAPTFLFSNPSVICMACWGQTVRSLTFCYATKIPGVCPKGTSNPRPP